MLTLLVFSCQASAQRRDQASPPAIDPTEWSLPTPDASQAKLALIPFPKEIDWTPKDIPVGRLEIQLGEGWPVKEQQRLQPYLTELLLQIGGGKASGPRHVVRIEHGEVPAATIPQEAYRLQTKPAGSRIIASTSHGVFNGLQTLRQLLHDSDGRNQTNSSKSQRTLAGCSIRDWPSFRIRGVMLDVGRNYLPPAFIKQQVEKLSQYKINVLHLHLTEDAAWRLQIRQHPELTEAKYQWKTRQPGQHYSQEEMRDLIAFCRQRHIEVIPEIDMPGHSEAFRHATGVDMQSPEGVRILKEVIDEVVELFPSPRLHIGSDEVRIMMKEFMPTMIDYIRSKGKEVIVWGPGLAVDPECITMHWGDHTGHQVDPSRRHISTIGFYMDWVDSQSGVYQYFFQQPCDVPQGNPNAMGAVTCVWTDGALSGPDRILSQYPFYPCSLTFAERLWRGAHQSRPDLFAKLPQPNTSAYRAFSEFEQRLTEHRDRFFRDLPFAYVQQSHIPWRLIGPFDHKGKNDTSFEPETIIKETYQDGGQQRSWEEQPAWGSAIHLRHFYSVFNLHQKRAFPDYWPATMNHRVGKGGGTCYALTYINSPKAQDIHLMFGIGGQWGHSGGYRTARAPEQGQWDFSGGNLWINQKRINPPRWSFGSPPWTGWKQGRIEETPLTEEGYFFRPPVVVTLNEGWNQVLIRVPFGWWKGDKGQRKWFFNCLPVAWDGKHYREVDGLKYSIRPISHSSKISE